MVSGARLLRALKWSAAAHGCDAEATLAATRDWGSATFVGARYDVEIVLLAGASAEGWIAALPDADLPMPRQFARDVRVIARADAGDRIGLTVEVLVLED